MTRKLTFAIALAAATAMGSLCAADEGRDQLPVRTAVYSSSNSAQVVDVARRGRYRGNYYNNRRYNYYRPRYGYRYNYAPYGYGYYPRYGYSYPRSGYYNNYGRGGVQFGRFGVWW